MRLVRARGLALTAPVKCRPLLPMLLRTTHLLAREPPSKSFLLNSRALARGVLLIEPTSHLVCLPSIHTNPLRPRAKYRRGLNGFSIAKADGFLD